MAVKLPWVSRSVSTAAREANFVHALPCVPLITVMPIPGVLEIQISMIEEFTPQRTTGRSYDWNVAGSQEGSIRI